MPKVNIYLPDDLADEVRAAKLSLSPVCQKAIREELGKMHAQQAITGDLETVAARLRATVDEEERAEQREGHKDGVKWAREYATASQLRWIAQEFEPGSGGEFDVETFPSMCGFMSDKRHSNFVSVAHEEGAYWNGFSEGAGEVLAAVEPLLMRTD